MAFYRAFRFPWSGRPLSPPAVLASLNDTGEETIVHASWNGATEVAAWRVLAGKHPGSLAAQATIPASGFESSTTLPEKYARVAVQALDSAGHVLGTSRTVPGDQLRRFAPEPRAVGMSEILGEPVDPRLSRPVWWSACAWSSWCVVGLLVVGLAGSCPPLPPHPATATVAASGGH